MIKLFAPSTLLEICLVHKFWGALRCSHMAKIVAQEEELSLETSYFLEALVFLNDANVRTEYFERNSLL
jgi:hypothetical protein